MAALSSAAAAAGPALSRRPAAIARRSPPAPPRAASSSSPSSSPSSTSTTTEKQVSPTGTATYLPASYAGRVRSVTPREAGEMMRGEGGASGGQPWVFLDVRPPFEQQKVAVEGAAAVPLFLEDPEADTLPGMVKAMTAFGMGGWWLGGKHLVPNPDFLEQAAAALPADKQSARVVVACQKGLRSLAACEQLVRAGYPHVAWISGGLDSSAPGDVPTAEGKDVRYAGIGGLSEMMGWTDVQREQRQSQGMMQDMSGVFAVAGVLLVADLALFAYEQYAAMTGAPNPFSF
jgi:rhodanese-related sulfurtransferase